MKSIGIFYGSSLGDTRRAAQKLANLLGEDLAATDVQGVDAAVFARYDILLLGTSTWGLGEVQEDWAAVLPGLKELDLSGKQVALFAFGDQIGYGDTYVNSMRVLYDAVVAAGATVVGRWSCDGYDPAGSRAIVDGKFVGLALDNDNQRHQTDARIDTWAVQLKQELGLE